MKNIIIGTAGHIDHGKTELIRALTGVDTDRLKEEKERGITIDIGFASLKYGNDLLVGFIDVPGHERFVKNMLAGAASVDAVLLVVAADESVKPQTIEHFDICKLLGVKSGIAVLTKIDSVDEEIVRLAEMEVSDLLKGSFMEKAPILRVSSKTGEGIDDLKHGIHDMAIKIKEKSELGIFRLPVDRSFSIKGFGTVVTGSLVSGQVRLGDEVELLPAGLKCRVRGIEVHDESQESAHAGQRTALNLTNIGYLDVARGDTLARPGALRASMIADVRIVLLKSARPLRDLSKVRFHYGTSEVLARLKLLEGDVLTPDSSMYVQLRMERAVVLLPGDKFIIRFYSPSITIGGGTILDSFPEKHKRHDPEIVRRLSVLESENDSEKLSLLLTLYAERGASLEELERRSGFERSKITKIMDDLITQEKAMSIPAGGRLFISWKAFDVLKERTEKILRDFHKNNPLISGMGKEALRRKVARAVDQDLFDALLEHMGKESMIRIDGGTVSHADHAIQLSSAEQEIRRFIEDEFRNRGLNPPEPLEVLKSGAYKNDEMKKIFQLLVREGVLVKVEEDRIFHRDHIEGLKEKLGRYARNKSIIDIASFKELAGITRKNAIPLLEYFDSIRVTRRVGNERMILTEHREKD